MNNSVDEIKKFFTYRNLDINKRNFNARVIIVVEGKAQTKKFYNLVLEKESDSEWIIKPVGKSELNFFVDPKGINTLCDRIVFDGTALLVWHNNYSMMITI